MREREIRAGIRERRKELERGRLFKLIYSKGLHHYSSWPLINLSLFVINRLIGFL